MTPRYVNDGDTLKAADHNSLVVETDILKSRLDKLEARIKVEEGTAWAHPDLTFRLNQLEEQSRSHTRAIDANTATISSLTNAVNAHSRAVESLTSVDDSLRRRVKSLEGAQQVLPPPETKPPWNHYGPFSSSPGFREEGTRIKINTTAGYVELDKAEFLVACRSYLHHKGEDV